MTPVCAERRSDQAGDHGVSGRERGWRNGGGASGGGDMGSERPAIALLRYLATTC